MDAAIPFACAQSICGGAVAECVGNHSLGMNTTKTSVEAGVPTRFEALRMRTSASTTQP